MLNYIFIWLPIRASDHPLFLAEKAVTAPCTEYYLQGRVHGKILSPGGYGVGTSVLQKVVHFHYRQL